MTDQEWIAFKTLIEERMSAINKQVQILRTQIEAKSTISQVDLTALSISLNEKITNLAKQLSILDTKVNAVT